MARIMHYIPIANEEIESKTLDSTKHKPPNHRVRASPWMSYSTRYPKGTESDRHAHAAGGGRYKTVSLEAGLKLLELKQAAEKISRAYWRHLPPLNDVRRKARLGLRVTESPATHRV